MLKYHPHPAIETAENPIPVTAFLKENKRKINQLMYP